MIKIVISIIAIIISFLYVSGFELTLNLNPFMIDVKFSRLFLGLGCLLIIVSYLCVFIDGYKQGKDDTLDRIEKMIDDIDNQKNEVLNS